MQRLVKIQVTAIFLKRDMRRIFLPKFIEICIETPCCCPYSRVGTNMAAGNQEKHLSASFATKAQNEVFKNI